MTPMKSVTSLIITLKTSMNKSTLYIIDGCDVKRSPHVMMSPFKSINFQISFGRNYAAKL